MTRFTVPRVETDAKQLLNERYGHLTYDAQFCEGETYVVVLMRDNWRTRLAATEQFWRWAEDARLNIGDLEALQASNELNDIKPGETT